MMYSCYLQATIEAFVSKITNTLPHWELFALHSNLLLNKPCATFGKLLKTGFRISFGLTAGYPAKIPTFPGGSGGLFGPELFLGEASGSFGVDGWRDCECLSKLVGLVQGWIKGFLEFKKNPPVFLWWFVCYGWVLYHGLVFFIKKSGC